MRTRLLASLTWVIPALPGAMLFYTWANYKIRPWADYLIIPAMLASMLVGCGTIAGLLALRSRGKIRFTETNVVCGLVLAALDIIVPIGLVLLVLLVLVLLETRGGKLSF
jgi:hypothetical protein